MAEEGLDEIVEDELWENQRRDGSNGAWFPVEERGRFSDRFGRFRFPSLSAVPVPKNSRVVEDWHLTGPLEQWQYARTYAALESDVAKGVSRFEQKWNSSVRWRRYVRKRRLEQASSEVISGWLGSKERRGTWKSRYFILLGSGAAASCAVASGTGPSLSQAQSAYDSEDDSSNDEMGDDGADEPEEDSKALTIHPVRPSLTGEEDGSPTYLNTPTVGASSMMKPITPSTPGELSRSLDKPSSFQDVKNASEILEHPPVLLYFRRGFTDSRSIFAGSFDLNEIRSFPKKQVRILKLSSRARVDDSLWNSEHPGKFAVKVSSARKRVLNAASSDQRERWVDAIRSVIEEASFDGTASPTSRRHGPLTAAFRAAKRGQQELRKGLGGLRRSSQSGAHPALSLSASLALTPLAMPVNSPPQPMLSPTGLVSPHLTLPPSALGLDLPTYHVELWRSMPQGALNLRLHEVAAGKGLVVENVSEHARDAQTGAFPSGIGVGDVVVAIQGEPLVGLDKGKALRKLKDVLAKFPVSEKVALTLTKAIPKGVLSPRQSSSSPNGASDAIPVIGSLSPRSAVSPRSATLKPTFGLDGDESEREDHARELLQSQFGAEAAMNRLLQLERHPSTGSMTSSTYGADLPNSYAPSSTSLLSPPLSTTLVRPSQRPKVSEVPLNSVGITSAMARSTTKACLDRMLVNSPGVTYAQLRHEVARQLHAETIMDSDEWRFFFRDLLDYWLCDGIKYAVGGLDLNDFTPVILKVSEPVEPVS